MFAHKNYQIDLGDEKTRAFLLCFQCAHFARCMKFLPTLIPLTCG
jgi:hypothetical protein